ncbi:hypothetical protein GUH69_08460, partial [Xanthomonas citri pv. citri]|nr:hypothetical protein [Xanthomonas citri pv. citri]
MNANNVQSAIFRAKAKAKAFRNRAAGAIGTVSLLPALAFAQAAGPGEAITTEAVHMPALSMFDGMQACKNRDSAM